LRLCHGALLGTRELTVDDIRKRVIARYPEAEALPGKPDLDGLLARLDLALEWSSSAAGGKGAYVFRSQEGNSAASSTNLPERMPTLFTQTPASGDVPPEVVDARLFENKLRRAATDGTFLALTVAPKGLEAVEKELARRFGVAPRNVDEILIGLMRRQAEAMRADWQVVLKADAAARDSQDWRNLMILVSRVMPALEQELLSTDGTALLVYSGLLARYDKLEILERLRDRVTSPTGTGAALRGLWVLVPADEQNALPTLDRKPVPVISSNQWSRVPEAWLANVHRAGTGAEQPRKGKQQQ
jgi:hypothetical protein